MHHTIIPSNSSFGSDNGAHSPIILKLKVIILVKVTIFTKKLLSVFHFSKWIWAKSSQVKMCHEKFPTCSSIYLQRLNLIVYWNLWLELFLYKDDWWIRPKCILWGWFEVRLNDFTYTDWIWSDFPLFFNYLFPPNLNFLLF